MWIKNSKLMKKSTFLILLCLMSFPLVMLAGCKKHALAEQFKENPNNFANVPGTVIVHSPKSTGIYRGTPSLVKLPNGHIITSNDVFGTGVANKTDIFISKDNGKTWEQISTVNGAVWSGLFYHKNKLYLLGANNSGGANLVIRGSDDEGKTWSAPTIIVAGACHGSSTPVLFANGRIYKAYEFHDTDLNNKWMSGNKAYVVSASQDADLLNSVNWTQSEKLEKPAWIDGTGWLESNAVLGLDGKVKCITRLASMDGVHAGYYSLSSDGKIEVGSAKKIQFWGGASKFNIKYDPVTQKYWSLTNYAPAQFKTGNRSAGGIRNVLALTSSADLETWQINAIVLADDDVENVGFQYVDWIFDGNDILFVSRTSFDDGLGGADNFHNANFMTFHKIEGYKTATTLGKWLHLLPNGAWNGEVKTFDVSNDKGNAASNPILISQAGQLAYLAEQVYQGNTFAGKYFKMTNDIDLNKYNFMSIGWYITTTNNRPFSGNFDGGGFKILNLNINRNDNAQTSNGLFGYVKDGSISNLGIVAESTISVGGVCAGLVAYGNNVNISDSYNKASVKGSSQVGGIMGYGVGNNTIKNCYNVGSLILNTSSSANKYIGGLAGYFKSGIISYSYNVGNVSCSLADLTTIGGVLGIAGPNITQTFYHRESVNVDNGLGMALAASDLKSATTLNNLNKGNKAWVVDTQNKNNGFPILKWEK